MARYPTPSEPKNQPTPSEPKNEPKDANCHYEVLGVERNATLAQIRRAYRDLAKTWHPDKTNTEDAANFRRVQEAYECLANEELRERYDLDPSHQPELSQPSRQSPPHSPPPADEKISPRPPPFDGAEFTKNGIFQHWNYYLEQADKDWEAFYYAFDENVEWLRWYYI